MIYWLTSDVFIAIWAFPFKGKSWVLFCSFLRNYFRVGGIQPSFKVIPLTIRCFVETGRIHRERERRVGGPLVKVPLVHLLHHHHHQNSTINIATTLRWMLVFPKNKTDSRRISTTAFRCGANRWIFNFPNQGRECIHMAPPLRLSPSPGQWSALRKNLEGRVGKGMNNDTGNRYISRVLRISSFH